VKVSSVVWTPTTEVYCANGKKPASAGFSGRALGFGGDTVGLAGNGIVDATVFFDFDFAIRI